MSEGSLTAAVALSVVGGVLTLVVGGAYLLTPNTYALGGVASTGAGTVGSLAVLAGFILILLGLMLNFGPETHTGYGIGIIFVSALTFWGGLLFVPGIVLCLIGGIFAILHEEVEEKVAEQKDLAAASRAPPPVQKCSSCGQPVGLAAKHCPECGAQLNL